MKQADLKDVPAARNIQPWPERNIIIRGSQMWWANSSNNGAHVGATFPCMAPGTLAQIKAFCGDWETVHVNLQ